MKNLIDSDILFLQRPKKRIIARLDIKNEFVIKGVQLEGLRKVGDPNEMALKYYNEGIDELIFMDAVASYYDRNSLSDIIKFATKNIFVPITVGGGIRNIEDIKSLLDSSISAKDVAVLFRVNALSRSLEEGFNKAGLNYKLVGGMKFYERAEIKDLIAFFRILTNANDNFSLKRIVNKPTWYW